MYYLVPYFICMFYQIYILRKKELLSSYPSFLIFTIPILIICYTSLYLGRFSFVLQFLITMTILSILSLVVNHLLFGKRNILSYIHTRYFYIISILVYLYVFISLNGKSIGTSTAVDPFLSATFILFMCLCMLCILNSIGKKYEILWRNICSWKLFVATILANLSICFFTVHTPPYLDIRITMLLYGILLLIPYWFRIWGAINTEKYQVAFSTSFGLMILMFILLSTANFIFPNIPLLYYYDIFIHRGNQIGLYATVLLLFPSMKKMSYPFLYHIFAFVVLILCFLLFC